ncbi:L,D-transpeptidase [Sporolactobacillus spathodeae]|uniref:Lipoprotein-anchoring transpeptidase ErfK/SrfK n=1 Tax=Sporolactobacillus spathodeae TaxID=1465502 RepID=A0ABS2Q9L9_9BACL|nr:L,D-transpeptidase [Sporolactobacillus spathodeae]MBM7658487.1 lipoprotein-anchoring transpeptidase ErfK/SrfK [Sporolactobacillus spathodeae]
MNYVARSGFALSALLIGLNLASCSLMNPNAQIDQASTVKHAQTATKLEATKTTPKKVQEKKVTVNWNKPSGGPYPKLKSGEPIWIDVSIKDQRVYIKDGDKTIYTMIASTGLDTDPQTTTPTGTYYIQGERGKWFYSPRYKEGAEYWVSWKNHGEFLFHSVPMNEDKKVLAADAARLGEKDSHGCVHLTVPDAKWIYENIAYNTKVVIH